MKSGERANLEMILTPVTNAQIMTNDKDITGIPSKPPGDHPLPTPSIIQSPPECQILHKLINNLWIGSRREELYCNRTHYNR